MQFAHRVGMSERWLGNAMRRPEPIQLRRSPRGNCAESTTVQITNRNKETLGGSMNIRSVAGRKGALAVLALFFLITGSIALMGQQTTGSIVGTVTDSQGAVVNTAAVRATNVDTGFSRSASANGYGEYRIDYLPVGKYTVEVTAPGFERFRAEKCRARRRPDAGSEHRAGRGCADSDRDGH